jgi:hypothetical protein
MNKKIFLVRDASTYTGGAVDLVFTESPPLNSTITITSTDGREITYTAIDDGTSPALYEFTRGNQEAEAPEQATLAAEKLGDAILHTDSLHKNKFTAATNTTTTTNDTLKLTQSEGGAESNKGIAYADGGNGNFSNSLDPDPAAFSGGSTVEDWIDSSTTPQEFEPQVDLPMSISPQGDILFTSKASGIAPTTDGEFSTKAYVDSEVSASATSIGLLSNQTGQDLHGYITSLSGELNQTGQDLHGHVSSLSGELNQTGQDLHGYTTSLSGTLNISGAKLSTNIATNATDINTVSGELYETGQLLFNLDTTRVLTEGDQTINGRKSFTTGVQIGNVLEAETPLNIAISGAYEKSVINFRETNDNHFSLIADFVGDETENRLYFSSRGTDWADGRVENILSMKADGRVGIGIESPDVRLHVNGSVKGTSFSSASDERYKTNTSNIEGALDKVQSMQGVYFNWNTDEFPYEAPEGTHIGLVAQDAEKFIPELVDTDSDGYKSISYDRIAPLLIEAIKEQQEIINELKADIEELKNT